MDEQRIWAPWRLGYIAGDQTAEESPPEPSSWLPGAESNCFMCRAAASYPDSKSAERQNLVIFSGSHCLALLNRYPYSNGHLLVTPLRHVGELVDLTPEEHLEMMQMLGKFTQVLAKMISAEGFNLGVNLGHVGGAGKPEHLHWHLVPRWPGDHNFMTTLAGTRVIPQSLEALWEALVDELE
ncbi:MAG: HIT domain-containing protein [Pirellulales bacterium]|nr:HIT domain-containing protein [Pirellulales bacterium]